MAKKKTGERFLTVPLPEQVLRRAKAAATLRGLKLSEAVRQALEAWVANAPELTSSAHKQRRAAEAAPQSTARIDRMPSQRRRLYELGMELAAELKTPPPSASTNQGGAGSRQTRAVFFAALLETAQLDWSAYPALQRRPTAGGGQEWVFRGADFSLTDLILSVQEGHSLEEIAEELELDLEQVKQVLSRAAHEAEKALKAG